VSGRLCLDALASYGPMSLDVSRADFKALGERSLGDGRVGIQTINEAQRKNNQRGGMTHHVNLGRPGCRASSRAQGSIGVPPVFPIRARDVDQKHCRANVTQSDLAICSL
jgi:hypothetical protein